MTSPDIRSNFENFEPPKRSPEEDYQDVIDDNEIRESLMGRSAAEFDEGEELNYHEDTFHDESISRYHTDIELEGVIKELLRNSHKIDARDITVSVDQCNVKLSGTVRSQEARDYVLEVVRLVHGVGEVESEIIVKRNQGILPTDIGRNP